MKRVELLVSHSCSSCERSTARVLRVLESFPDLEVVTVDILERPEAAVHFGFLATPALVIDGRLVSSGIVQEGELRRRLSAALKSARA